MNFGSHRLNTIVSSFKNRTTGGPLDDWFLNTLGPGRKSAARRNFTRVHQDQKFWHIEIEGVSGCLVVSRSISFASIQQAFYEQYYRWHWHNYQIPETAVTSTDTVFDCGCAEGMFTFLNQAVAGRIICFEPLPEFQDGLIKTFINNRKVQVVKAGLGDKSHQSYLRRDGMASTITNTPTDTRILVTTIDDYCERTQCNMNYLKADLEGDELRLLNGAKKTIRRCRPKIAITTYHVPSHAREIRAFLEHLVPSYRFWVKGVEPIAGEPVMLHAWSEQ